MSHRSTAYEFFIKDSSQAQLVANVITNITIGNAQYPPEPMFNNGNPTFVCVSPGLMGLTSTEGITHDAYDNCEQNEGSISFYLYPKPWIMLCPGFFELPSHPASDACPTVDRLSTHFIPKSPEEDVTGESISRTQIWSIFHELVYYYLYAQPGYEVLHSKEQVYNINKAWKLSPAEAFENAENWVYYAYMVSAKCTKWPILPGNERELLEGGNVGPDLVDDDHAAMEDVVNVTSARVMEANQTNAGQR